MHPQRTLALLAHQPGVLVSVERVDGSGPRGVGAWMAVFADTVVNTIGGGHLEFQAIADARALLLRCAHAPAHAPSDTSVTQRYALGPALGQCCGGVVFLRLERITLADAPQLQQRLRTPTAPVALFGGGHVGSALVQAMAPLPFSVHWIDSRDEIFPTQPPANAVCEHSDPVHAAVADLAEGSAVLIMSFSHAEDLDIVAACLQRQRARGDLRFIGLIGSQTKWASFRHRLQERGFSEAELAQITCPIGITGITGKQPEVIAASVVAQLLQRLDTCVQDGVHLLAQ